MIKKQRYIIIYADGLVGMTGKLTPPQAAEAYSGSIGEDAVNYLPVDQAVGMAEGIIRLSKKE